MSHTKESRPAYERVTLQVNEPYVWDVHMSKMRNAICRTQMSHVPHSNESRLKWMRHVSHVRESCLTRMKHTSHTQMSETRNETCRTQTSNVLRMNESPINEARLNLMRHMSQMSMWNQVYHTQMSQMRNAICRTRMSHVPHSNESRLKWMRHVSHVRESCLERPLWCVWVTWCRLIIRASHVKCMWHMPH